MSNLCYIFCMEKVNIPALKSFITIEGAGADKTIVQWNDTAQTPGPSGKPLGTIGANWKTSSGIQDFSRHSSILGLQILKEHRTHWMSRACHSTEYRGLTAQGRSSMLEDTGFSFVNCKGHGGQGHDTLEGLWGPFSRVVFAYTYMDNIIISQRMV
ncbi:Pectin lyase fold/virulence factor [Sesbania bispinosa]|nr:Pectin lyase fold/virulence factor [Sesbania bispinosa]